MDTITAGRTLTRQIDALALDWDTAKLDTIELTQVYVDTADRMPAPIKFSDLDTLFAQWNNVLEFHGDCTAAWTRRDGGSPRLESELVVSLREYVEDLNHVLKKHGYVGDPITTDDVTGPLS